MNKHEILAYSFMCVATILAIALRIAGWHMTGGEQLAAYWYGWLAVILLIVASVYSALPRE